MTRIIDLRSDTVTRPVPEMRQAIAGAEVGDDVFGDDPTVIELERRSAELLGKEAALFVPSGTMANQIALASITRHGDEVLLDRQSHIFNYEAAAPAALSGVQLNPVDGERGVLKAEILTALIRPDNVHYPRTSVIALENTHNRAGGRVYPFEEMLKIREMTGELGLKVHLDGARLANAVAASGIAFDAYAGCADTVSMCFSKGLGAPVGSIVASKVETIDAARRKRKQFGGGMRQAGIIAAGALYALDNHMDRLKEDHNNARRLGGIIEGTPGLSLLYPVETNIVVFSVDEQYGPVSELLDMLGREKILAVPFGGRLVRMVTHLDISEKDIDLVGEALKKFKRN